MKQFDNCGSATFLLQSTERIRFLCSVADDYEFICPGPPVYFDPVTYQPSFCIDRLDQVYRADFLIRHRGDGRALLVELHPATMTKDPRLQVCRRVAENYIRWKGLDWGYQCLF